MTNASLTLRSFSAPFVPVLMLGALVARGRAFAALGSALARALLLRPAR